MSGVKGRSGRKKSPRDVLRYLTEQIDDNWSKLVDSLIAKALNGDREALMYCFDRRLGKPKATTEIDMSGGELLGAGVVVKLFQMMDERRRELKRGEPALLEGVKREDE